MAEPPAPPRFVTLTAIRQAARRRLPRAVWNFGAGGAETETTRRRNRRHLDRLAIQQNVLVDVRQIDLRTTLLGVPLAWPVTVAPMGGLVLFHPEGDLEMARGTAQAGTLLWVSGSTGWPVEQVAKAGPARAEPRVPGPPHLGRCRVALEDDAATGRDQGNHDRARRPPRRGHGRAAHLGLQPRRPPARPHAVDRRRPPAHRRRRGRRRGG